MMDGISDDEESQFFDAPEDVTSISDGSCDGRGILRYNSSLKDRFQCGFLYDVWSRSPQSVEERRGRFLQWMRLNLDQIDFDHSEDLCGDMMGEQNERVGESNRAADEFYSTDNFDSAEQKGSVENVVCTEERIVANADKMKPNKRSVEFKEVRLGMGEECDTSSSSFSSVHMMKTGVRRRNNLGDYTKIHKKNWLQKLRSLACVVGVNGEDCPSRSDRDELLRPKFQRIKVNQFKKQSKELSALYMGQDIRAHDGAILAMKFSPDGQYLASGGEDGIVRLWQVVEDERSNDTDIPEIDPSCIYFIVNHLSELKPLFEDKENTSYRSISLKKTSESACVIIPPKVFRIVEKPLRDYCGHKDEISDLSWSKNNYLLSSSVDKTVRLWHVGHDNCIKVFSHSDYVTCVQFNPVDDNHFISGSVDGKVRIWRISSCQVVDWTDIREIVTAVSYQPDGEGGIVGSMTGDCRFYKISDNHMQLDAQISFNSKKKSNQMQLDAQISFNSKKKSAGRKITGFQFFPQDSSKVVVTCADSYVRILHGSDVVGKYKGFHNAGNQVPASFTSDGKYIVSACGDSNVYLWNSGGLSHAKKNKSYEHFSTNASVAVPWSGFSHSNTQNGCQYYALEKIASENLSLSSSPASFVLSKEYFLETFPKGSTLWPEEKLPESSLHFKQMRMHKSEYKFLKASCQKTSNSHAWGMVIVTAGWDGRIKSFHNYGLPVPV